MIDLVLAGDNAIVVGIGAATVLRILFAEIALQLLAIIGLALAGGVLLLWVCWKLFRDLRQAQAANPGGGAHDGGRARARKTVGQAVTHIVIADITMSLDNVLAVAGVARVPS